MNTYSSSYFYDDLLERVRSLLVQIGVPPNAVTPQAHFIQHLGMDSLDRVDLMMRMEHEFGVIITDEQMANIRTVNQAISYLQDEAVSELSVGSQSTHIHS